MIKRVMVLGVFLMGIGSWCGAQTLSGTAFAGVEGAVFFEFDPATSGQAQFQLAWDNLLAIVFMLATCGQTPDDVEVWGLSVSERLRFEHLNFGVPSTHSCLVAVVIGNNASSTAFRIRLQVSAPGNLSPAAAKSASRAPVFRRLPDGVDDPLILAMREKVLSHVARLQAER